MVNAVLASDHDHGACLAAVLATEPDLHYGFVADARGNILVRVGSKQTLPHTYVVDVTERPESIRAFYSECRKYLRTAPGMVPRMYAQGQTQGVIGIPSPRRLIAVFGSMPDSVFHAYPTRGEWMWAFRARVWKAVLNAYPASSTNH